MNDPQDRMDLLLRDYALRWRDAQPSPPTVDIARLVSGRSPGPRSARWLTGHAARWLPVAAAATAVALLAAGVALVHTIAAPPAPPATSPSPPAGVVPWEPLAATGVELPTRTLSPSPDPAGAEGLPPCRAEQLQVEPKYGLATGTRYLTVAGQCANVSA